MCTNVIGEAVSRDLLQIILWLQSVWWVGGDSWISNVQSTALGCYIA